MSYSLDLRRRVVDYVAQGGSKSSASRIYKVGCRTIYYWLRREDIAPCPARTRRRKLDKAALAADVKSHPDAYLRERAARFGVSEVAIFKALRQMNIVKKKRRATLK